MWLTLLYILPHRSPRQHIQRRCLSVLLNFRLLMTGSVVVVAVQSIMTAVPRGYAATATGLSFLTLATLTLVARLYTRFVLVRNAGIEEYAIIAAWVFSLAHVSLVCVEVQHGLGGRLSTFTIAGQEAILLPFYASVPMYTISLSLSKVSIILLYMRLFPGKPFAISCWVTMFLVVAFCFWGCLGFLLMCTPISALWDKSITNAVCVDGRIIYFTSAGFNILTDFILFGLPLPILSQLQLPRRQKWLLILLFGIGLIGCMTSIARLRSLYYLSISKDYTYDILEAAIWSCVETNVGFICACIPTLKPLIKKILPHLLFERNPTVKETPGFIEHIKGLHGHGRMPSHRAYAQFDVEGQVQEFEPGKVRVTTNIFQESDEGSIHNEASDISTAGLAF